MYYDIAPYILRNRKRIIPVVLVVLLINFFLSELIRGNLNELFNKNTIKTILILNSLWGLMSFTVRSMSFATRNWEIVELNHILAPFGIILQTVLLVISIPLQWLGYPYTILNFVLVWQILYASIIAESKNLEKYFYFRKSSGAIIFHNITIRDGILIFAAALKEKQFVIAEIEITDMKVTSRNMGFFVKIVENRVYDFYLHYTKKNFEVLQELIQICKKPPVTTEELNTQVSQASWSLW